MTPPPKHIAISTTTCCNVTPPCVMCGKNADPNLGWINKDAQHIPLDLAGKLRPIISEASTLMLHGIGEPLTCPHLFEIASWAGPDTNTQFTTNGQLLTAENCKRIVESRIHVVDVSIDATTSETYRAIRRGDFTEVVCGVQNLIAERDRQGARFPRVHLNMVLMRRNVADVPGLVILSKAIGADLCYVFHMNDRMDYRAGWFNYVDQHCQNAPHEHDIEIARAEELAKTLGVDFMVGGSRRLAAAQPPQPEPPREIAAPAKFTCRQPWENFHVGTRGECLPCCWIGGHVGNLNSQGFEEIWDGPKLTSMREKIAKGVVPDECAAGFNCPARGKP